MVDLSQQHGDAAPDARPADEDIGIMQVLPSLVTGGAERGAIDVALAAKAAGLRSYVVSSGGPMVRELVRADIQHIELPVDSKNVLTVYRNIDRIAALVREHNITILHARSRAPAWSAYYAAKRADVPFMTTFHATYNFNSPLKKAYNAIMTRGDRVIAISEFIRDHIMQNYRADWARLRVIQRGIDTSIFDPAAVSAERVIKLATDWRLPDGVPTVMLPGRLTRWKGHPLLLQALSRIKDMPFRCLLVGSDQGREGYRQELEKLSRDLGLESCVHIVGDCNDMAAAYKLSDVVVSASTDPEGFGRVAVEGQALGRPVVAPNHGAAPEQIEHGVTGWLYKPGDPDSLAEAIRHTLSLTPEQRDTLHDVAIRNVRENFTRERMCEKTIALYRELAGLRRGQAR